ncbi:isoprenyl synthetase [Bacteroidia bacterium]|nr:isoprenyl synthetase [Bacteroidia bacterium]
MISDQSLLELFQKTLQKTITVSEPRLLYEPIVYALQQGGKRIRPLLLLRSCEAFGGVITEALYPAMGIEIFHNFTLLHDDIMDQAPLRRGQATVYQKYNSNIAILSGDAMFAIACSTMCNTKADKVSYVMQSFSKLSLEICEGQQYDMDFETQNSVTIAQYMDMIKLKTSVLLGGALQIGAIIADASVEQQRAIYEFGVNIGLAFQLQDDWLDVYSNTDTFGKIHGGDILARKKTFLYLKALEVANEYQKQELVQYFADPKDKNIEYIVAIYDALNINKLTKEAMRLYHEKALIYLRQASLPTEFSTYFKTLSEQLLEREK